MKKENQNQEKEPKTCYCNHKQKKGKICGYCGGKREEEKGGSK